MTTLVIGAGGFIGRRLVRELLSRGESVAALDIVRPDSEHQEPNVVYLRGDVTQFDEVISAMKSVQATRVVNLAYMMGSDFPPRSALKLNVIGMDNCFEAARLSGVTRVVFGSSLAVSGQQSAYGERLVTEDDFCYGRDQYGTHKIFNEWQAQDYREKYGMDIVALRPAQVSGVDKIVGSVDHVKCITFPAAGESITLPYKDEMKVPIYVDDIADCLACLTLAETVQHGVYNSGGTPISLGGIADLVREFIPEADIKFEHDTGGKERSYTYLIDNSRLLDEFGLQFPSYRTRVLQIINQVRESRGLDALVSAQ